MCLFGFLPTLFCFAAALAQGKVDLEIIRTANGNHFPVLSTIRAQNETNFSLLCRVVDATSREKLNDGVVWLRKRGKSELLTLHGSKMLLKNVTAASLNFAPITKEHQGEYLCLSPKYRLIKAAYVKIVPEMSFVGFESKAYNLRFPVGRRKRSNHSFVDPPSADPHAHSNLNLDGFASGRAPDLIKDDHWDVKKVKLDEEHGRNETDIFKYHDGTTNVFRIGLLISFIFLVLLGVYRIIKCWRAGELGMFNNRVSRVTPNSAENNLSPESDSCEMIVIRPGQTEPLMTINRESALLNGGMQNGSIESMLDLLAQQRAAMNTIPSPNKDDDLPPTYEQALSNSVSSTPGHNLTPSAPPKDAEESGGKSSKGCNN